MCNVCVFLINGPFCLIQQYELAHSASSLERFG